MTDNNRLIDQMDFIKEIDKLKSIYRQTLLIDGSRNENDAEHSWHLSVMAMLLSEYVDGDINILKVLKMLIIHDLVEVYAGDTFCYNKDANKDKRKRELDAAGRLFGKLPEKQCKEFFGLWEEFEQAKTLEARFASAIDRFQPLFHNYCTNGHTWKKHGVKYEEVYNRVEFISVVAPQLWEYIKSILQESLQKGYFADNKR